jgi:hypothetical protein
MQINIILALLLTMNSKYMVIVASMAVMLIGATALATQDAFADKKKKDDDKKKYEKSQATSQANACGNGELPHNVFCQNIGSQVQGDENAVTATGSQSVTSEEEDNNNNNN